MLTRLTENFSLEEFHCHDGTSVPADLMYNIRKLTENLQILRDAINIPITILSGYRTLGYNAKVGGKKASKHLTAQAADIVTRVHTPQQLAYIIEGLIKEKKMQQGGIGIYPSFVHYDVRGTKARW